jgi:DNA-binding transcriptional ArsR family regulator
VASAARVDARLVDTYVRRAQSLEDARLVVVADRIPDWARSELSAASVSWLDRRGHLRLVGRGLYVDARVEPDQRRLGGPPEGIRGRAGLAYAASALLAEGSSPGIRSVARAAGLSAPSVSVATAALRRAGLLEEGAGRQPQLFWTLVDAWRPSFVALGGRLADLAPASERLGIGGAAGSPGWALTGRAAAAALGWPIEVDLAQPPQLYVPTAGVLREAMDLLGSAQGGAAASCRLAVAPTLLACSSRRVAPLRPGAGLVEPLVTAPLFVALELAKEPGGPELLGSSAPVEIRRLLEAN